MKYILATIAVVAAFVVVVTSLNQIDTHTCPAPTIEYVQETIGVEPDGKVGPVTIKAWEEYSDKQWKDKANETAAEYYREASK